MNDPPPPPSGEGGGFQDIEVGPPIDHYPITGKTTRLKWDRATGTLIIDPNQPNAEPESPSDTAGEKN